MKKAVILFNLGGPDSLDSVGKFLFNLFNDKNIITIPNPCRYLLAKLISKKRTPIAKEIYKQIGNMSPIFAETEKQAEALEEALNSQEVGEVPIKWEVFISMRYWHPFSYETIEKVKIFDPDEIILLPLYPQYSTTTSKSSIEDFVINSNKQQLDRPVVKIFSYHTEENFIAAHAEKIIAAYNRLLSGAAKKNNQIRILFSAHGLPEKIIKAGDPYQKQVEETVAAIIAKMAIADVDFVTCYQSRVGRLKWITPSTEDEIKRAGREGLAVIIVPVAFVSEHSETLVELDIEYKKLAEESGVTDYLRVETLGTDAKFIECLVNICNNPEKFV